MSVKEKRNRAQRQTLYIVFNNCNYFKSSMMKHKMVRQIYYDTVFRRNKNMRNILFFMLFYSILNRTAVVTRR